MSSTGVNVFSSGDFLGALADAWYPGAVPGLARASSTVVRTLIVDGEPIGVHPLIDFFEPVTTAKDEGPFPRVYAPRLSRSALSPEEWLAHPLHSRGMCAPRVTWGLFADWSAFERHVVSRRSNIFSDSRRRERRIAKDVGPLRLVEDAEGDERDRVLTWCLRWKSAQYARLGVVDLFADPRNTEVLRGLLRRGQGRASALYAGERLVAAHVGLLDAHRFYWWFPTYDSEFEDYSPGRLLLHRLLASSHERGDAEFDFLWGDESYKWLYATDTRLIEDAGRPPLRVGLRRVARLTRDRAVHVRKRGWGSAKETQGRAL